MRQVGVVYLDLHFFPTRSGLVVVLTGTLAENYRTRIHGVGETVSTHVFLCTEADRLTEKKKEEEEAFSGNRKECILRSR